MTTSSVQIHSALPRVLGAAATGAILAIGARSYLSWADRRSAQTCQDSDTLCVTWWNLTALPLILAVTLLVLTITYKHLDIRPRLVIIPPTVLLAPIPLAVGAGRGWSAVALAGAAWSGCLALAAWKRSRVLALTASTAIFLAAMILTYH
ncbi:hypothetical protein SAMN05428944_0394 [Streptomyces sp. 1222.5]|uniref:hypothetical protein n=1 Tax=unclassified Streptomyces TaxID=2593676 RepID=UPI00089A5397|nr:MULTISPECIES: hypothetical protein [unclassified Streptomyces]PKW12350.1 hypothetical protein BX260_7702 [Streptomyces sp. 5112.2]SEB57879.1 hypothetical protein SAMN05428944_0394 [Streptomyces sp. 1222.5]